MSFRIHVTVECDAVGCAATTLATAKRSHFPFRLFFEWYDVRFPSDPSCAPSRWFHGFHPEGPWWAPAVSLCPDHAPKGNP